MSPVMRGCQKCGNRVSPLLEGSNMALEDKKRVTVLGKCGDVVVMKTDLAYYKSKGFTMLDGSKIVIDEEKEVVKVEIKKDKKPEKIQSKTKSNAKSEDKE